MATKTIEIEGIGPVRFQKRRGTRSVRIHIQGHSVRVTQPTWVSYVEAKAFVKSRRDWINNHKLDRRLVVDGTFIGKRQQLRVIHADIPKAKTRLLKDTILVTLPHGSAVEDTDNQQVIEKACERALLREVKELLTPRIQDLAYEHGFEYTSLHFKKLKRRWGSCDADKHIILNIFLTQLPWKYIDYVLLHELTHTKHLNHGAEFWAQLEHCLPGARQLKKQMHEFHPQLLPEIA